MANHRNGSDNGESLESLLRRYLKDNERRWEDNERRWETNEHRWYQNERRWQQNDKKWERAFGLFGGVFKELKEINHRLDRIEKKL